MMTDLFFRNTVPAIRGMNVSNKHSSQLDVYVELCCMSAMMKIRFHSDQKFHHQ